MEFFKSSLATYITTFLLGFLTCLFMTKKQCVEIPSKIEFVDTGGWVQHDTSIVYVEVPKPYPVVRKVSEIPQWVRDTLTKLNFIPTLTVTDSLDSLFNDLVVPINHYEDSLFTDEYTLRWKAETFGFLTSMVPEVTVHKTVVERWDTREQIIYKNKKPNWNIGIGASNLLNYKFSVGYKGFNLEPEFNKSFKFNQVYLTKQFTF